MSEVEQMAAVLAEHWFNDGGDWCECGYWAHLDSVKRHHIEDEAAQVAMSRAEAAEAALTEAGTYIEQLTDRATRAEAALASAKAEALRDAAEDIEREAWRRQNPEGWLRERANRIEATR